MARFSTIEASPVFDIDFRLRAFLPCVPFLEAVRARGVGLASGWALAFWLLAALWFLPTESAPDKGAHLSIVRSAALYQARQLGTEDGFSIV